MGLFGNVTGALSIFKDAWWEAWETILGLQPRHRLPYIKMDIKLFMQKVGKAGVFGFGVTGAVNAQFFQLGIDGATDSFAAHSFSSIDQQTALLARRANPDIMRVKEIETYPGYPTVKVGGVSPVPNPYEVVEAKMQVSVTDLERDVLNPGEQAILFFPPYTQEQRLKIALELYSWVGKLYDISEIGSYVINGFPNSRDGKCCSTLTAQGLRKGDPAFVDWCDRHHVDIERIPPRDIFNFGVDMGYPFLCWQCRMADAMKGGH